MPRGQKDAAFYDSAALLVLSLLEEADKTGFQLLHEVECRSDCAFAIRESRLCRTGTACAGISCGRLTVPAFGGS